MARHFEPAPEQMAAYAEWVAERPECVRKIAERFQPWELYRLKTTEQRVVVTSFSEDGTLTVVVSKEFNFLLEERRVFGIDPDDLEPCDLPGEDEPVGLLFEMLALQLPDLSDLAESMSEGFEGLLVKKDV